MSTATLEVASTLHADAISLAELDHPVLPIRPNEKTPLTQNGLKNATVDTDIIDGWFTQWPNANLAIRCDGMLVIDVDVLPDGSPNPWLRDDPEKLADLARGAQARTPRGGRHFIFRLPTGSSLRQSANALPANVDIRVNDLGYILVAPSRVNDRPYAWVPGSELDCRADQLPFPPQWLVDLLTASPESSPSVRSDQPGEGNAIPDGQRNRTLTSLGGTMRRKGMSETAIAAALKVENTTRCKPPMGEDEVELIAWSVSRYEPDQIEVAIAENHFGQVFGDVPTVAPGPVDPGPFPAELLIVPGFIGQVMDHTLATAFVPQPELALAAALPLQGVLAGRKVEDDKKTRTNCYTLGVCDSGGGKERARQVNKEVLFKSGQQHLIGPEGFASHVGIINAVEHEPSILFQWDEIGRVLRTTTDARNANLYHAPTVLLQLFSNSASVYLCPAYADRDKNKSIDQPNACLYGTTVPQSLYEGLTSENVTDGLLSRLLIFEAGNSDPEPQDPIVSDVPNRILDVARWWGDFKPVAGNLADRHPSPLIVPYRDGATAVMRDLRDRSRIEKNQAEAGYGVLWSRVVEKARKLALLWACSRDHRNPVVTIEGALWAAQVSEYLTRRMIFLASRWISENRQESNVKKVQRIIEQHGRIDRSSLTRLTQWLTKRERDEILLTLAESGSIRTELETSATKPRTVYVATGRE